MSNFQLKRDLAELEMAQNLQEVVLEDANACINFSQALFVHWHLSLLTKGKSCLAAHDSLPLPPVCIHPAPLRAKRLIGHIMFVSSLAF